jgi:hypothetical protein
MLKASVLVAALAISVGAAGLVRGSSVAEAPAAAGAENLVITIYAHQDTYIKEDDGNTNFGDSSPLMAGNYSGYERDILLKFDLSALPADAVVVEATLKLTFPFNYAGQVTRQTAVCDIFPDVNTGGWQEMTVTWNNAPGYGGHGDPATTIPDTGSSMTWDVTNAVDDWERGTLANNGFRLRGDRTTPNCGQAFMTRDVGFDDWKPQLIVTYTAESATATHTPTATDTPTPTSTSTPTPTPTPSGIGGCPGTVVVYPDHDTYVDAEHPGVVYGDEGTLSILRDSVSPQGNQRNALLHFPIEELVDPGYYIYDAKLRLQSSYSEGDAPEVWWRAGVYGLEDSFQEYAANWSNRPELGSFYKGMEVWTGSTTIHEADVTELVRAWYSGAKPNNGIGVMPGVPVSGYYRVDYRSKEASGLGIKPELVIECGEDEPTPTPTPTETPTPTPSSTPTVTPTPVPATANVRSYRMEVTQGVQNNANAIPLLEGKRTYVRILYSLENPVSGVTYRTTAKLNIYRSGVWKASVLPINNASGYLDLVEMSWWNIPDQSFIFELPSEFTNGEVRLQGVIDPDAELPESSRLDNFINRTVSFEPARAYNLHVFLVRRITEDGTVTQATYSDFAPSLEFAKTTLPFADVSVTYHGLDYYEADLGDISCDRVNEQIASRFAADGASSYDDIYYGFMPGWVRGCSNGIPADVASSSVDDWRGTVAHELGHCFGRHHTQDPRYDDGGNAYNIGCDAGTGCWYSSFWWGATSCPDGFEEYPYDDGSISPGIAEVLGFYHNSHLQPPNQPWSSVFFIPDRSWKDLMTYCNPQVWASDFTWENIYDDQFSTSAQAVFEPLIKTASEAVDRLVVVGTIYSTTGVVEMQPLYVLPDVTWAPDPGPGDYAIVLRDANNSELVRHAFEPGLVDAEDFGNVLSITELVPYVEGTVRVDIEGPDGLLSSVSSGAASPTVEVLRPDGGETVTGDSVRVSWRADDPDGDPLSFNVQYSADDGATWSLIASNVMTTSVYVDVDNMPASDQARIRVLASDGIHTAHDSSDGPFTVPNHRPSVEILTPQTGETYIVSQTIGLDALVHDADEGTLDPTSLRWSSSLDGTLGQGMQLSITGLSPGRHTITLDAVDGERARGSDTVRIEVFAGPDDLPPVPDVLRAEPALVVLNAQIGIDSQPIYVYNHTNPGPIAWTAAASDPWVGLSATSGTTPGSVAVSADTDALPNGRYTAAVTFTALGDRDNTATVNLSVTVRNYVSVYLPLVLRSDS